MAFKFEAFSITIVWNMPPPERKKYFLYIMGFYVNTAPLYCLLFMIWKSIISFKLKLVNKLFLRYGMGCSLFFSKIITGYKVTIFISDSTSLSIHQYSHYLEKLIALWRAHAKQVCNAGLMLNNMCCCWRTNYQMSNWCRLRSTKIIITAFWVNIDRHY